MESGCHLVNKHFCLVTTHWKLFRGGPSVPGQTTSRLVLPKWVVQLFDNVEHGWNVPSSPAPRPRLTWCRQLWSCALQDVQNLDFEGTPGLPNTVLKHKVCTGVLMSPGVSWCESTLPNVRGIHTRNIEKTILLHHRSPLFRVVPLPTIITRV